METGSLYVDQLVPYSSRPAHCILVVVSERMLERVKMCEIRSEIYGASDHCPIVLEIDDALEGTDDAKTSDDAKTANDAKTTDDVKTTDTASSADTIEATDPSAT